MLNGERRNKQLLFHIKRELSSDPQEDSGSSVEECTPLNTADNWFGCVGSRAAPDNAMAGYDSKKFPPIFDRTCGQPIMELTGPSMGVARLIRLRTPREPLIKRQEKIANFDD